MKQYTCFWVSLYVIVLSPFTQASPLEPPVPCSEHISPSVVEETLEMARRELKAGAADQTLIELEPRIECLNGPLGRALLGRFLFFRSFVAWKSLDSPGALAYLEDAVSIAPELQWDTELAETVAAREFISLLQEARRQRLERLDPATVEIQHIGKATQIYIDGTAYSPAPNLCPLNAGRHLVQREVPGEGWQAFWLTVTSGHNVVLNAASWPTFPPKAHVDSVRPSTMTVQTGALSLIPYNRGRVGNSYASAIGFSVGMRYRLQPSVELGTTFGWYPAGVIIAPDSNSNPTTTEGFLAADLYQSVMDEGSNHLQLAASIQRRFEFSKGVVGVGGQLGVLDALNGLGEARGESLAVAGPWLGVMAGPTLELRIAPRPVANAKASWALIGSGSASLGRGWILTGGVVQAGEAVTGLDALMVGISGGLGVAATF